MSPASTLPASDIVPSSTRAAGATLVIGPSWIGDAVMAQCLLAALARQGHTAIDVVAPDSVRPLLARMPEVRDALAAPFGHGDLMLHRRFALGASLRGRYAQAYVLPGSWKAAVVPWAARIPYRCGYLREWRWGLLNDIRDLPADRKRITALTYQALADPDVMREPGRLLRPHLSVDLPGRGALLVRWGLAAGGFAVLAPGAEFGDAKRWPERHWVRLGLLLRARGLRPVLLGAAGDRPVTGRIAAQIATETAAGGAADGPAAVDLAGRLRIDEAADLMSAACVAVSNDSGLMHVAAAVGCPVVAIYGSTSPRHTPPLAERARLVSLDLACSPCFARRCPLGHRDCLEKLAPELVFEHIVQLTAD